jgi:transposase-like protein
VQISEASAYRALAQVGARTPQTKPRLTPEQKRQIIQLYKQGGATIEEIAERFGVSEHSVFYHLGKSDVSRKRTKPLQ